MSQSVIVRLNGISKHYGKSTLPAVSQVDLTLRQGEILALLGPSGCGKTTLLRLIAGFERPETGTIEIADRCVAGKEWVAPENRHLGMVFQEFALFPHLTVAENVAFGLKQMPKEQATTRTLETLTLVGLERFQTRYPHELSGGQRQRVALARALAPQPALILLDEPLSNLDVQVRLYLREEVRKILKSTGTTAIFVTHDQEEALAVSDVVAVMKQGKIEQLGVPEEIYREPASRFVAGFVTQANFLPAQRIGELWQTEVGCFAGSLTGSTQSQSLMDAGELMIREEDVILKPDENGLVTICDRQFLGREHRYCLVTPSGRELHARSMMTPVLQIGTKVQLVAASQAVRVFPNG
jgi:iron(III) transport system ATP-binding protein